MTRTEEIRRMPKPVLRISLAVLVALCSFLSCPLLCAAEINARVRVGYYEDGDYMSRNHNGEYTGYNFEFLHEISKFSGLNYEVVDGVSWENTLAMLEKGEIDLLPAVYRTPERDKKMLFSAQPMCSLYSTLNVRVDDERYDYEDFASFQGMKVGIISNSVDGEKFRQFCLANNIRLTIIPYAETGALLKALEDKSLDGVAITYLGRNSAFRCVFQFSSEPLYIAVARDRPDLLRSVNKALEAISLRDPFYAMRLYAKYFPPSAAQKPVFTKEENKLIAQKMVVRAAYDPSWAPLTYTDPKTGKFSGVVADLFQHISEESGLIFRFEPLPQTQAMQMASRGEIDVLCVLGGDSFWSERYKLNATGAYLDTPALLIRYRQTDEIKRIALQRGYWLSHNIATENRSSEILYFDSVKECLDALLDGKADAAYANAHIVNYLLAEPRYAVLSVAAVGTYTGQMRIGVSRCADPRLFSILDKCIQFTSVEEVDAMVLQNTMKPRSITLRDFMAAHPVEIAGGAMIVLGLVTLLLSYGLITKSRGNRRIEALLYRDTLTSLDNIDKFRMKCAALLAQADDKAYALLYGDLIQFKTINDNYGFVVGDELLRAYGGILQKRMGDGEHCARLSADHFVLLLRYEGWDQLAARIYDLDLALDAWRCAQSMPYKIGAVFGVYLVDKTKERDIQIMLDLANYARREAKRSMKNTLMRYDEKMRQDALLQQDLNGRLEQALVNGEIEAWFQAKVDMRTGGLIGSEALVRWKHPTRGLLMPGSFIPLFERNGSVQAIDFHMFHQTCRALQRWRSLGLPLFTVSCNFSSLHFDRADFPEQLAKIAALYEIPHELLEVEITESAIMENPEGARAQIHQLKMHGFMTAIDDFGSGYSSLGQLQLLTADVIKLDRSFVQRDLSGTRAQIVLGNVIRLAMDLGISVICEGVENEEQAAILMRLGCFNAQGFYYAKPVPGATFEERLASEDNGSSTRP